MGASETRRYLTNHTITDDELMRELWDTASGLPGLLYARGLSSSPRRLRRSERDFMYDSRNERYIRFSSGRAVSEREIRSAVAKVSREASNRVREETKQMMAGSILFAVWYGKMRSILKALYRAVWVVTLGGKMFETDAERNAFYLWMILYFDKLDSLKIGIETGAIEFNGHIRTKAQGLARSANNAYQNAKLDIGRRRGHTEARRVLGENENHCHDSEEKRGCIELAEMGWMPIGKITKIGDATCRCISTPKSRILTKDGWKTFLEIEVGDFVLTHKMRWRMVTAVYVKLSREYHKQVYISTPTGSVIGATDTHLWHTARGWKDAYYIHSNLDKVYNIGEDVTDEKNLSKLQESFDGCDEGQLLPEMSFAQEVRVWSRDRSSSEAVQIMCLQGGNEDSVGENSRQDDAVHKGGGCEAADSIRGFAVGFRLVSPLRRSLYFKILGRREEKVRLHISLPVGVDKSKRKNTGWLPNSPQERECVRRQAGEFRINIPSESRKITRANKPVLSKNASSNCMSKLQEGVSDNIQGNREKAGVLFDQMPLGTLLYDITVDEDHSYCIEGLFSHNSNCLCQIQTRKRVI